MHDRSPQNRTAQASPKAQEQNPALCRALLFSSTWWLSLVRRIGVRLAHYDVRALWHANGIRVVNYHVNRAHRYAAADGAGARWSASGIAGLLIEGDGANPRDKDSRVGRRIVAHRHTSD